MTDIVERLREYADDDHERGCAGRCYDCSCGYDGKRDPLLKEAADEIERLRTLLKAIRNFPNLSTHYGTLIVAEIDAALKEDGDE